MVAGARYSCVTGTRDKVILGPETTRPLNDKDERMAKSFDLKIWKTN